MLKPILATVLATFLLVSTSALAKAPYLELYTIPYNASKQQCKRDSIDALKRANFKLASGTYQGEDTVGTKGDYKGVVSCLNIDVGRVIIIVTGKHYKTSRQYAIQLVDILMPSY